MKLRTLGVSECAIRSEEHLRYCAFFVSRSSFHLRVSCRDVNFISTGGDIKAEGIVILIVGEGRASPRLTASCFGVCILFCGDDLGGGTGVAVADVLALATGTCGFFAGWVGVDRCGGKVLSSSDNSASCATRLADMLVCLFRGCNRDQWSASVNLAWFGRHEKMCDGNIFH